MKTTLDNSKYLLSAWSDDTVSAQLLFQQNHFV